MRTVKLFATAEFEDQAALAAMQTYRDRTFEFGTVSTIFRLLLMVIAGVLPVLMVGITLWLWSRGSATAGDIAATGTVALRIAQMTGWVSFALMGLYANLGEVEDGMTTLSPPHQLTDRPGAVPLASAAGITFDNVGFAYGRRSGGVENISISIAPGEKIGLVGASGAGKSTLVSLLLRLYDTETGAVRIGGQDVRDVTQDSLRRQIGMVTQETAMFNRSAMDNIRYGRPDAPDDAVIAAATAAQAHEFILRLVDFKGRKGYDAHLGERGVKLSGGQRQRIAIARAILKDAPILVLDEATSHLDTISEAQVRSALTTLMRDRTTLLIAHRLSTIRDAHQILVLSEGHVLERGTHDELLRRPGFYSRLVDHQTHDLKQEAAASA
jgi:ATP-binding cassette subfamily B protein